MKKILFGINQNPNKEIENKIVDNYKQETEENVEFKSEYYIGGIERELKKNKYDVLILNERLEPDNQVSIKVLDTITDRYPNLKIIFIAADIHEKDSYIKSVFAMGIYNVIYEEDLYISALINLIKHDRTKSEAKVYLELEEVEGTTINENEIEVVDISDDELETIIKDFSNCDKSEILPKYKELKKKYNQAEINLILSILNEEVLNVIQKDEDVSSIKKQKSSDKKEKTKIEVKILEKEIIKTEKLYVKERDKQLLVILSIKSGGSSYVASNLASDLDKKGKKVGLIDLDLKHQQLSNSFFIDEEHENSLLKTIIEPNKDILKSSYRTGKKRNIYLYSNNISSTYYNDYKDNITSEKLVSLIDSVRDLTNVTIVDYKLNPLNTLTEKDKLYLRLASTIIVVTNGDYSSILEMKKLYKNLEKENIPYSKVLTVINNFDGNNKYPKLKDIKYLIEKDSSIKIKNLKTISHDPLAIKSSWEGMPSVIQQADGSSKFIKDIEVLADEFTITDKKNKNSLLNKVNKLFSKK